MSLPVIYEVRLEVDAAIADEFDAWLDGHINEMLAIEGFVSAEIVLPGEDTAVTPRADTPDAESEPPTTAGRVVRIVRYRLASRDQLERYLATDAPKMREKGVHKFGNRFSATRAIYQTGKAPARSCQNCATPLIGQYCNECGQRDKNQVISLWELVRDLIGDVFEVDSRVWRTLRPLLFRPGLLTVEYLRGRRVHYTPPLRLYLVTSLIFFLVVFSGARTGMDDLTLNFDDDEPAVTEPDILPPGEPPTAEAGAAAEVEPAAPITGIGQDPAAAESAGPDTPGDSSGGSSLSDRCEKLNFGDETWPAGIEERARHVCRRLTAEGGARQFLLALLDNIPGMMFFFLPAIALVMVFLYPFSQRYYVEHLLFFVHYHSFFFAILSITLLFSRLPVMLPGQGVASGFLTAATSIYLPVYLFVAMRRVYAQSRLLTAVKYGLLGVAYMVGLLLTFVVVVLLTALTV